MNDVKIWLDDSKIQAHTYIYIDTWNPKQPFINGCFNWMIPNFNWEMVVSPNIHLKMVVRSSRYLYLYSHVYINIYIYITHVKI